MPIVQLPREEMLGRYRLAARLGRGGMAELFLARLIGPGGFEKLVAIKRMLPHLSADPQFVAMFENEGRIAAELSHPNLCQVYELGEADGQLFLAMELLRGLPWSEIVPALPDEPQAPFLRFIAGVVVQVCEGLHYAHTATDVDSRPRPVVHRDVTPSNVFVTSDGIVKLLDFGVSKILNEGPRTRTGMLKGKLPYMAPEQVRNEPLDARTDLFALGTLTWEAIAGRTLFDRDSDFEIWKAILEDEIPVLPVEGPVIAQLDAVVRRSLSRDRAERQPSARVFADEIRAAIAAYGDPMAAAEIQAHVKVWLGPSLARASRDLADIVGRLRNPDAKSPPPAIAQGATGEVTGVHTPLPPSDVRIRNVSVVVGADTADAVPEMERASERWRAGTDEQAADTTENVGVTDELAASIRSSAIATLEVPAPVAAAAAGPPPAANQAETSTTEITAPREVIATPAPEIPMPGLPRVPNEALRAPSTKRPAIVTWMPVILVAIVAFAIGMIIALWH